MSKTVDKKVVEMSFDNRNFEKNVKTSLSTIEKLKSSLNFSGMTKGLDELSASANRVNFNPLTKGIEQVGLQFNALYSVADQTMRRITNTVMDFGLNLGKKLVIDPKKAGFDEYELKMSSIQTIMAGTGESLEKVNEYLEELNKYSDQTIYSFQDMTTNIGKFTNMGVELEDAVAAIKGVSNEAALSGANANEASRAMYNFAQALSAGYVKLIDWKSIENANMATKDFKNELIQTAVEMGTLTKTGDDMYETLEGETLNAISNFNDSLKDQWMTSDVLITTLKKYSSEETIVGQKAKAAAQDVKTFSMLIDTLTEAVQSGWAQSFQIIFGDFNQAKKLWTGVSNALGAVIDGVATIRNKYLNSFLGKTFTKTFDAMSEAFSSVKESTEGLKDAVKTVADYANVVDEIINGIWGNGQARWDKLSEAGYDWAHAQNLVNERLGFSLRRETSYVESTESVAEATDKLNESTKDWIANIAEVVKKREEGKELNQDELIFLEEYNGLSKKQQDAINQIVKLSKRLAMPVKELLHNMDDINGRWLLMESFGNIGKTIITIFHAIGKAWVEVFPPKEAGTALFNLTTGFYKLTRILKDYLGEINDHDGVVSNAEHLVSIFKGLFGVIGVVSDAIKSVLTIALKTLGSLLGLVIDPSATFLEVLGNWGNVLYDATSAARKWIKEHVTFTKVTETIIPAIVNLIKKTKEFITTNETVQKVLGNIKKILDDLKVSLSNFIKQLTSSDGIIRKVFGNLFGGLSGWINGLAKTKNIPMYIISGLLNGLVSGTSKVTSFMGGFAASLIKTVCKVLGIASPSKEFFKIGKFIILGLLLGMASQMTPLKKVESTIWKNILNFGTTMKNGVLSSFSGISNILNSIDYRKMFAIGLTGGLMYLAKRMNDTVDKIIGVANSVVSPLKSFADMMKQVGTGVQNFLVDLGTAKKLEAIKGVIKGIALSLLMIAASMYIISKIEPDRLTSAAVVCGIMLTVLTALFVVVDKLAGVGGTAGGSIDAKAKKATFNIGPIIGLSLALLAMTIALKKLSGIDTYSLLNAINGLVTVIVAMTVLLGAIGGLTKLLNITGDQLVSVTKSLKKIATSLLLMILVIKLASKITKDEVNKAIGSLSLAGGIFAAFIALSKFAGKNADKAAWLILSLTGSMMLLLGVIKIASMMKPRDVAKGGLVVASVVGMMGILMAFSSKSGKNANKAALLIGGFSLAMLGIVASIKLLSTIPKEGLTRGTIAMAAMGVIISMLIGISHFAGKNAKKAGVMLLEVAGAIAILAAIMYILSTMETKDLVKGTTVIAVIAVLFSGLIAATSKSKDATKTLTSLIAAMSVLLGFVIVLSLIKPQNLLTATAAVTAIMLSLSLLIQSAKKMNGKDIKSLVAVSLVLMGTLAIMTILIHSLSKLDPERALASAGSLSTLLIALSGALATMTIVSKFGGKSAYAGVALLLIMSATVLPLLALIISALVKLDPDKSIKMVTSVSIMLLSMTAVLGALTLIGLAGPAALVGIGSLIALIAAFGGLLLAFGGLNKLFPNAAKFLESGIPILTAIGTAIGSFVGSIVAGFGKQLLTLLPVLGQSLSLFMTSLTPFFVGSKMIDGDLIKRIGALSASILILSAAELVSGIMSLMSGKTSLTKFGLELSLFMVSIDPFIKGAANIKPEVATSMLNLSKAILALTGAKFIDSISIFGKTSFEEFGTSLAQLGTGLANFNKNIKPIKDVEKVRIACEALKLISEAAATIPNSGGIAGALLGDNDPYEFAVHLPAVASGLVGFIDNLDQASITKDSLEPVKVACEAIKRLAKVSQEIPNAGGLLSALVGDNDMYSFSVNLPAVANGLASFIHILDQNGITEDSVGGVKVACSVIKQLTKVAQDIPNAGGLLSKLVGDNDFTSFGRSLPELAVGIAGFVTGFGDIEDERITTVSTIINSVINLLKSLKGKGLKETISQSINLKSLGSSIADFMSSIAIVDDSTILAALGNVTDVVKFVKSFETIDTKSITGLSTALKDLGDKGIKGLLLSFENQDTKTKLHEASKAMAKSAIEGVKAKMGKDSANKLGENFVRGLANGIADNQYLVINASTELGKEALQAAKDALKEKSPSKATHEMGKFFDLGLVNGIVEYARNVYSASNDVGETAKLGISDALGKITDIINSESDMGPTITPVLDLSNIESGATRIGSIFDGQNIGIGANINAISAGLKLQNQNAATNSDIVSAIDKLKTSMSEQTPGNTYNLNGISYNDDTPIANAVSDLIKAIEIERRA